MLAFCFFTPFLSLSSKSDRWLQKRNRGRKRRKRKFRSLSPFFRAKKTEWVSFLAPTPKSHANFVPKLQHRQNGGGGGGGASLLPFALEFDTRAPLGDRRFATKKRRKKPRIVYYAILHTTFPLKRFMQNIFGKWYGCFRRIWKSKTNSASLSQLSRLLFYGAKIRAFGRRRRNYSGFPNNFPRFRLPK